MRVNNIDIMGSMREREVIDLIVAYARLSAFNLWRYNV